jgi:hypothetical protein
MKEYDLIVIERGSGMEIAQKALGVRSKPTFKFNAKTYFNGSTDISQAYSDLPLNMSLRNTST